MFCTGRRRIFLFVGVFFVLAVTLTVGSAFHPKTRSIVMPYVEAFRNPGDQHVICENDVAPDPPRTHHEKIIQLGPPTYDLIRQYERTLPQHTLTNPFPEGKTGRYVKFANQIHQLGWNNCFNEILMNGHLAYMSNRSYVFHDFYWSPDHYRWPESKHLSNPPRTPLNAIIAGPTAGGLWEADDPAPRSISEEWFETVCPQSERRFIHTEDIKTPIMEAEGTVIFETWRKVLHDAPERCIEVLPPPGDIDPWGQTFDLRLWGSTNVLGLLDDFLKSPTSRLLESSPLVNSAVERNQYLFFPHGPRPPVGSGTRKVWDRVLAMHLRRGDYENHCKFIASSNFSWYSWNLLPSLPDQLYKLPDQKENEVNIMNRCWPSVELVAKKARDVRAEFVEHGKDKGEMRTLDIIYILSNDQTEFMDALRSTLKLDGWNTIVMSKDLELDQEQTDVSFAVDMDIAQRAAVFVGNGWSSYTSNVGYIRLKNGKELISTRFF